MNVETFSGIQLSLVLSLASLRFEGYNIPLPKLFGKECTCSFILDIIRATFVITMPDENEDSTTTKRIL